jgi:hypothetical protein
MNFAFTRFFSRHFWGKTVNVMYSFWRLWSLYCKSNIYWLFFRALLHFFVSRFFRKNFYIITLALFHSQWERGHQCRYSWKSRVTWFNKFWCSWLAIVSPCYSEAGDRVTRLDEFTPFRWVIVFFVFLVQITEKAQIFGLLFPAVEVHFDKHQVGPHFVRSFHKRVWSPWPATSMVYGTRLLTAEKKFISTFRPSYMLSKMVAKW